MKFGTQILDKSVPEWKLHNIDYQQLKTSIRRCTTVREDQESQFAPSKVEDDPELRSLRRLFRSQFEMVNVFVSMKLKECSTRIVSIENYLTQVHLIKDEKKKLRRIKLINQHLDRCNLELQKLSRYLILQKIAVRKLFKKFLKHYPYGEAVAQEFVDSLKSCPEFKEGHEGVSMLTVDLDPYLLEISLIVDLLHEMELDPAEAADGTTAENGVHAQANNNGNNFSPTFTNPSSRKSSVTSTGHIVDTTLNYDHYFLSKFNPLGSFLVSQESEDEIKFLLIKLGFCLFDDSVIATSKKILSGDSLLSKKKTSIKSLHLFREAQRDDVGSSAQQRDEAEQRPVLDSQESEASSKHSHHRAYSSSSTHNILFEPLVKPGADITNLYNSTEENLFPNLLVSYPNSNDSILLCHVGGLRNHISTDSIQYSDIKSVLKGSEPSLMSVSNRLDEFCRDWCYSHNFKFTDFSIKCRRSRFVISHSTVETSNDYLICLDDKIEVNDQKLPFAILEVKILENKAFSAKKTSYSKKHIDPIMVDLVDKLVRDNLSVYPTDKNFTLWNMASKLALNGNPLKSLDDNEFDCIEDMFEAGKRNLQKINEKNQTILNPPVIDFSQLSSQNTIVNNSPHTPEEDKPKIRYWNEFDDGDEAMDQDFYSYSGEENDDYTHDTGLIKFNPSFIIAIYHVLSKFQIAFGITDDVQARKSLLRDTTNSYNSIGTETSMLTSSSERNDVHKFWELEEQNSESIYEFEHDQVISFFYVSSLLISCLTTGVTIGIMTSLFNSLNDDTQLENETPILTMIFISLSVSLVLGAWSLLLLFSRFTFAPTWHYITSVVIFIIIIFAVCYGFIELIL